MPVPKKLPRWAWIGAVVAALVVGYFVLRKTGTAPAAADTTAQDTSAPQPQDSGGGSGGGGTAGGFPPVPVVQEPTTNVVPPTTDNGRSNTIQFNPPVQDAGTAAAIAAGFPLTSSTTIGASMMSPSGINVVPDIAPLSGAISPLTGDITLPTVGPHGVTDTTIGHVPDFTSPVLQRIQAGREQRLGNP